MTGALWFHPVRGTERPWCESETHRKSKVPRQGRWRVMILARQAMVVCPACRKQWEQLWVEALDASANRDQTRGLITTRGPQSLPAGTESQPASSRPTPRPLGIRRLPRARGGAKAIA